jgi:hypothetical protein
MSNAESQNLVDLTLEEEEKINFLNGWYGED